MKQYLRCATQIFSLNPTTQPQPTHSQENPTYTKKQEEKGDSSSITKHQYPANSIPEFFYLPVSALLQTSPEPSPPPRRLSLLPLPLPLPLPLLAAAL